jgi:hypothetical protein
MSTEILNNLQRWGLPNPIWRYCRKFRNQQYDPPYHTDSPELCDLGEEYWHNYPIQNYQYEFNSWGFRDCDFDQYRKEVYPGKVNICVGDSFTINIGGPKEHSWPSLLSKYYSEPTLNLAINGLSAYYFSAIVDKCKQLFNVDKVFVLYNLLEDSSLSTKVIGPEVMRRAQFLKNHSWIPNAYWQFIPPWVFDDNEVSELYKCFPGAHSFLTSKDLTVHNIDIDLLLKIDKLRSEYYKIAGLSWIPYETFCQEYLLGNDVTRYFRADIDQHLVNQYLVGVFTPTIKKMHLRGRDVFHMSRRVNQALADCFYQQTKTIPNL